MHRAEIANLTPALEDAMKENAALKATNIATAEQYALKLEAVTNGKGSCSTHVQGVRDT